MVKKNRSLYFYDWGNYSENQKELFCQIPGTAMSQTHTKTLSLLFLNKITVAQNMKVYDIDWYSGKK